MTYRGGVSLRSSAFFARHIRLWIAVIALLLSACGSSKPKPAAEKPATEKAPAEARSSAELRANISDFCQGYTDIYCVHEPEDGRIKETTYEHMPPEEQDLVLSTCEDVWAKATEPQRKIMSDCAGCINDCGYTETCLTATSSGCLEPEPEGEDQD